MTIWQQKEIDYPGLALMARDILAIPIAGVGVERTFNFARDICHYRRGRLSPETITSIMLVRHAQIQEDHRTEVQHSLSGLIDTKDMSEEEMELELKELTQDMSSRQKGIQQWDNVEAIPDKDPLPRSQMRTVLMEQRKAFFRRNRSIYQPHTLQQTLSRSEVELEEIRQANWAKRSAEMIAQDRANPHLYDGPNDDEGEDGHQVRRSKRLKVN